jgi:Putative zinc-finger
MGQARMIKFFTCRKIQQKLEQHCQGLLSRDQALKMERHIRRCPACSREYKETQNILNHLAVQRLPDPGEAFWNRMRSSIMTQISGVPARPVPWYNRIWAASFQWPGYAWATALLLLVLAPVLLYTIYPGKNFITLSDSRLAEWYFEGGTEPFLSRLEGLSNQESEHLGKKVVAILAGEIKTSLPRGEEEDWSWDTARSLETLNEKELEAVANKLKTRYPTG